MCSYNSIFFLSVISAIASLHYTGAAPLTSNSTFQEELTVSKYTPVNITSNSVIYNVLLNLDQIEIYASAVDVLIPTSIFLDRLGSFDSSIKVLHCELLETFKDLDGVSLSEVQAKVLDQLMGFVPTNTSFSTNRGFDFVVVDTDNHSYFAMVTFSNSPLRKSKSILTVAKKQVSPTLDQIRTIKIVELTRKLHFGMEPIAVSSRKDCENLQLGNENTEDTEDVEDNEDAEDSEEV